MVVIRINTPLFFLGVLFALITFTSVLQDTDATADKITFSQGINYDDYFDSQRSQGTTVFYSYDRLLDYSSNGKPFYTKFNVHNNQAYIDFEAAAQSYKFDKLTCSFKTFPGGKILAGSVPTKTISHSIKEAVLSSETYNPILLNDASCNVSYQTLEDGLRVVATKSNIENSTNTGGVWQTVYDIDFRQGVEYTYQYTNKDVTKTNHKYGFTTTCEGLECGQIKVNGFNVGLNYIVTKDDLAGKSITLGGKDFDPKNEVHDYLKSLKRIEQNKIIVDFTDAKDKLGYGDTLIIDPTFLSSGSIKRYVSTSTTSSTCSTTYSSDDTSGNQIHSSASTASGSCEVASLRFSISGYDSTRDVTGVKLLYNVTTSTNAQPLRWNEITNDPNVVAGQTVLDDIRDGDVYVSSDSQAQTTGLYTINLGTTAVSDLQSAIDAARTWFAVGGEFSTELTRDTTDRLVSFSEAELHVEYQTQTTPHKPTGLTSTEGVQQLQIDYTGCSWDGSSANTCSAITSVNLYNSTNQTIRYSEIPIPDYEESDPEYPSVSGSVNTDGVKSLFHFEELDVNGDVQDTSGQNRNATAIASTVLGTPNFEDDFTTDKTWVDSGQTTVFNAATDVIDWNSEGAANQAISKDLQDTDALGAGNNANDATWLYRTKITIDTRTNPSSGSIRGIFGLSSADQATTGAAAQDFIGLLIIHSGGGTTNFHAVDTDAGVPINGGQAFAATGSTTSYWLEVIRTGTTSATVELFSDAFVTSIEKETLVVAATTNTLRYPVIKNEPSGATGGALDGTFDDVEFCDGVTAYADCANTGSFSIVLGKIDNSLLLDGAFVNFTNPAHPVKTTNDFTLVSLVNFTSISGTLQDLFAFNDGTNEIEFEMNSTNIRIRHDSTIIKSVLWSPIANQIQHVAIKRTSNVFEILVNGTEVGVDTTSAQSFGTPQNNNYTIGANSTGNGKTMTAVLDEFAIFSESKSHSYIASLANRVTTDPILMSNLGNVTSTTVNTNCDVCTKYYRLQLVNAIGNGTFSDLAYGTTTGPPDAVGDLSSPVQTVSTIELSWSEPELHGGTLLGYQINYTTPHATPLTVLVNNTNATSTNYVVSGLFFATQYSFRVAAWTTLGTNASGNTLNTTTEGETFTVGSIVVNQTNPDIVDIRFERIDINNTASLLNVTYPATFDLACEFSYKFARSNNTYTSLEENGIDSTFVETSFTFVDANNEIIDVFCWDQLTDLNGTYILTWSQFPLLDQIQNFRAGEYGTEGKFGVLDMVTFGVIIISMIGFNRVNETVGAVFNIILLGALAYFQIIVLPTLIFGAIATMLVLIVAQTRKD